ncbi:hypothetical protein PGUG_02014 [Meyerozyma guilliermondii ATCC 6260]|uniref:Elongin-A n=1 Tax=Meyerozyma guilliermondii (strain ATCC 6260 / CBS 566 / DSM 6381 / JCM 1539 / NBRC 10279 / NRRL Y-324) TaxID=294746 RepID=A5DFG3_PICGU|nr:uncharacterized protein PGUG_02014 [Meyerozyma guilliermondii ATCC 6260]EDK37916.2 hypothetical protein PGUG_02014 [Meyerozyma guilliermondii ATCC 6260]
MPIQRLRDLAAQKCVSNVALLHDVGDTPYHILKPILCRMSARQLDQIESKSSQIIPYSDQLWPNLISRDFPNRPLASRSLVDTPMPHKALYFKYLSEREALQRDSAQRLRSMTQRLRQEKSKNAITPVKHLLRDPTIRRRPVSKSSPPLSSLSIIQRARRETQERSRLFQKNAPKDSFSKYLVQPKKQPVMRPAAAHVGASAPLHAPKPIKITETSSNAPPTTSTQNDIPKPQNLEPTASPRKRRPPSIFLSRPKRPSRPPPKTEKHTSKSNPEPSEVQAIRSTIFNK